MKSQIGHIMILDGYAVCLTVERGHLVAAGGVADERTERHVYRSDRNVDRILVLASHGSLSLSALRWCTDVGIPVIVLDPVSHELLSITPSTSHDDARLRRCQALASGSNIGLGIVRNLLEIKLAGQAEVIRTQFGDLDTVDRILAGRAALADVDNVRSTLLIEANAAGDYFSAWAGQPVRFGKVDVKKVPPNWLSFTRRTSALTGGHSPRQATDPINALLNYCYTLAAAEATIACHTLGLDPGFGFLHTEKRGRDSLAWDLIETVRPQIDAYILDLIKSHTFSRGDFTETRTGQCRILEPLTHQLVETMPTWAEALAPHAEALAHTLIQSADGSIRVRRPLTGKPKSAPKTTSGKVPAPKPEQNCPDCGGPLGDKRRLRCPTCTESNRLKVTRQRVTAQRELITCLEESKVTGDRHRRELGAARSALSQLLADLWEQENPESQRDPNFYRTHVFPDLEPVPVARIRTALGIGNDAAWRIRNGTLTPHPRHWDQLRSLAVFVGRT